MIRHCDKFFLFDTRITVETAEAINVMREKFIAYVEQLAGLDELASVLHEESCATHERNYLFPEALSHQLPYGCSDIDCIVDFFFRININTSLQRPQLHQIVAELRQLRIRYLYHRQDIVNSLTTRASCMNVVSYQYDMVTPSVISHHEKHLATVGELVRDLRDPMKIEYKFDKEWYKIMNEDSTKHELSVNLITFSESTPFCSDLLFKTSIGVSPVV